jgi:hypothetical protein
VTPPPAPDPADRKYDVYQSLYAIIEYRDGAVYRTNFVETAWFPKEDVDANVPAITGFQYVAASDEFARAHVTIRTRKEG